MECGLAGSLNAVNFNDKKCSRTKEICWFEKKGFRKKQVVETKRINATEMRQKMFYETLSIIQSITTNTIKLNAKLFEF